MVLENFAQQGNRPFFGKLLAEADINNYKNVAIPYKTTQTPFQEHGASESIVVIIFCLLSLAIYGLLKRKGVDKLSFVRSKKINVIERLKVTSRASILLIEYNNRFFLISQSADNLTLISEVDADNKKK